MSTFHNACAADGFIKTSAGNGLAAHFAFCTDGEAEAGKGWSLSVA